jgi:hypothetical protein
MDDAIVALSELDLNPSWPRLTSTGTALQKLGNLAWPGAFSVVPGLKQTEAHQDLIQLWVSDRK